jgi:hypothetical protein
MHPHVIKSILIFSCVAMSFSPLDPELSISSDPPLSLHPPLHMQTIEGVGDVFLCRGQSEKFNDYFDTSGEQKIRHQSFKP